MSSLNPIRINPSGKSGTSPMEFVRHAMLAHLKQEPGTPTLPKQAPHVPAGIGPDAGGQGVKGLQPLQGLQGLQLPNRKGQR